MRISLLTVGRCLASRFDKKYLRIRFAVHKWYFFGHSDRAVWQNSLSDALWRVFWVVIVPRIASRSIEYSLLIASLAFIERKSMIGAVLITVTSQLALHHRLHILALLFKEPWCKLSNQSLKYGCSI
jgi:hypothetical protein